jgi:hypothetical protein
MHPIRHLSEKEIAEWYAAIDGIRQRVVVPQGAIRPQLLPWRRVTLPSHSTMVMDVWWRRDGFRI